MEQRTYSISELAREFDVTTRALRFYEDKGLLKPRRLNSRRIFSRGDRVRLMLVLRGKRLGFTLRETRELFDLYESAHDGEERQLERLLKMQEEKRVRLLQQRNDVDAALAELEEFEQRCRSRLEQRREESRRSGMK